MPNVNSLIYFESQIGWRACFTYFWSRICAPVGFIKKSIIRRQMWKVIRPQNRYCVSCGSTLFLIWSFFFLSSLLKFLCWELFISWFYMLLKSNVSPDMLLYLYSNVNTCIICVFDPLWLHFWLNPTVLSQYTYSAFQTTGNSYISQLKFLTSKRSRCMMIHTEIEQKHVRTQLNPRQCPWCTYNNIGNIFLC